MVVITKETWENGIEVIVVNGSKWLNEIHIEEGLDYTDLPVIIKNTLQNIENIDLNLQMN